MKVILVIAEDNGLKASLKEALPESYLVLFEVSVDDALRRLISIQADLLLIDDMPSISGESFSRLAAARPGVPALVLNSRDDNESKAYYILAGAKKCIAKPFACDELNDLVDSMLSIAPVQPAQTETPVDYSRTETANTSTISQHQTALRWLSRLAGHMEDTNRLAQNLADALLDVFHTSRCAVLLEGGDGRVRIAASSGIPAAIANSVSLEFSSGLMRWFEEHARLFDRNMDTFPADAAKDLQVMGLRLSAPIMIAGHVHGALAIGEKESGEHFCSDERQLFTGFTRSASSSIENAKLYRDVNNQRHRMDAILDNVNTGIVVVGEDRRITILNKAAERTLRVRATDMLGRSVQKLGSNFTDVVLRAMAEGKPRLRCEIKDTAIDARLGLSVTPMQGAGCVVFFSCLPEKGTKEKVDYSPIWEYLASRIAQEIKNPMVAINTFAQLLPKKHDRADFRDVFSKTVQREIARINNVVDNLSDFSRSPRLSLNKTNVNKVLSNILKSFENEFRARDIDVKTSLDPDLPEAELDSIYFSQAVHNIIRNSIDAMPAGGKLSVKTKTGEGDYEVLISDTGPGVGKQDSTSIFLPFFSTKENGMGLGLTLAHRILRQHRGELKLIDSEEGGSAFELRVPVFVTGHEDDSDS